MSVVSFVDKLFSYKNKMYTLYINRNTLFHFIPISTYPYVTKIYFSQHPPLKTQQVWKSQPSWILWEHYHKTFSVSDFRTPISDPD